MAALAEVKMLWGEKNEVDKTRPSEKVQLPANNPHPQPQPTLVIVLALENEGKRHDYEEGEGEEVPLGKKMLPLPQLSSPPRQETPPNLNSAVISYINCPFVERELGYSVLNSEVVLPSLVEDLQESSEVVTEKVLMKEEVAKLQEAYNTLHQKHQEDKGKLEDAQSQLTLLHQQKDFIQTELVKENQKKLAMEEENRKLYDQVQALEEEKSKMKRKYSNVKERFRGVAPRVIKRFKDSRAGEIFLSINSVHIYTQGWEDCRKVAIEKYHFDVGSVEQNINDGDQDEDDSYKSVEDDEEDIRAFEARLASPLPSSDDEG